MTKNNKKCLSLSQRVYSLFIRLYTYGGKEVVNSMDDNNYTDLLEALTFNTHTIILAAIQEGKLVDWVPAGEYCTIQEAKIDHEWPPNAELSLLYGLDALLRFSHT